MSMGIIEFIALIMGLVGFSIAYSVALYILFFAIPAMKKEERCRAEKGEPCL